MPKDEGRVLVSRRLITDVCALGSLRESSKDKGVL